MVDPIDLVSGLLQQSPVFESLDGAVRRDLSQMCDLTWVRAGDYLWRWASPGDQLALVLEGTVEMVRGTDEGKTVRIRTVGQGDVIGFSALTDSVRTADARARTAVHVAWLPKAPVLAKMRENPEIALRALREITDFTDDMADEVVLARDSLDRRVWHALRRLADRSGVVRATHAELASDVGAERANVSRVLRSLEKLGQLQLGRGQIIVDSLVPAHRLVPFSSRECTAWMRSREVIPSTFSDPRSHASTLAESSAGLVVAFFGGERHEAQNIQIRRCVRGKWTRSQCLPWDTKMKISRWNPVLHQVPGGPLLLFFKQGYGPAHWQGWMTSSDDDGATWAPSRRLANDALGPIRSKPAAVADGTLVCPSSSEVGGWTSHIETTSDLGVSWDEPKVLDDPRRLRAIQPSLCVWTPMRWQVLCRTATRHVAQSWTEDGGHSWSPLEPTPFLNPNSAVETARLADGRAVLAHNPTTNKTGHGHGGRGVLALDVSSDGHAWRRVGLLEEDAGDEFSYPAMIVDASGALHVTYTAGVTWNEIRHVVLDPMRF